MVYSERINAELGNRNRCLNNISLAQVCLKSSNSVLSQLNDLIVKARKITIQVTDKTANHEVWKQAVKDVERLSVGILETANNPNMGGSLSSRNQTMASPFRKEKMDAVYPAYTEKMELEIEPGLNMKINPIDSNSLTEPLKTLGEDSDLDPGIDRNTWLSDLNRGRGVNLGSIKVTKKNRGRSREVSLLRAVTVGDVIDAINSSGTTGLRADIGASKKGLNLTLAGSRESISGREFVISEAGGTTARDLGILTTLLKESPERPGSWEGRDLNPILTEKTPISLLKVGKGMILGTIKFALGNRQAMIDLSSASTAGDIIDAINNSIPGVIASINGSKRGISIEAKVPGKSLVVSDGDDKKSATCLGISGSPDILGALLFLIDALNRGDYEAVARSSEILNLSSKDILNHRAEVGARLKLLEAIRTGLIGFQPDTSRLFSNVSEADVSRATTDLANQQSIFESALKRGATMIQPALLNFIR